MSSLRALKAAGVDNEIVRLRADLAEAREVIILTATAMNHAQIFVRTRERMHPDGVSLFKEDLARARAFIDRGA